MRGLICIGIYKRKSTSKPIVCGVCKQRILPELEYGVRVSKGGGRFPFHLKCATGMLEEAISYRRKAQGRKKSERAQGKIDEARKYMEATDIVNRHLEHYSAHGFWWTLKDWEEEAIKKYPDLLAKVAQWIS